MDLTGKQQAYCPDRVDCSSIYSVRQSQAKETPVRPEQGSANPRPQGHPAVSGMTTSLPSRHRDTVNFDTGNAPPGCVPTDPYSQSFRPSGEKASQGGPVDGDMDFSPEIGLAERNPPSDHPTPSTLNSSSNASYPMSGADNPSPGKKQKPTQGATSSFEKIHTIHVSPSTMGSPPMPDMGDLSGQFYPHPPVSLGATGAPPDFSMAPSWDMSTSAPALGNTDFGNVNVDSLSEAQWVQILNNSANGAGWEGWRQS